MINLYKPEDLIQKILNSKKITTKNRSEKICFHFFNVCLFLRERECERQNMNEGGSEREGDTESEAGSRL